MREQTIYVIETSNGAGWGPIDDGSDSDKPHAFFSRAAAIQEASDLECDHPGARYRAVPFARKVKRRSRS